MNRPAATATFASDHPSFPTAHSPREPRKGSQSPQTTAHSPREPRKGTQSPPPTAHPPDGSRPNNLVGRAEVKERVRKKSPRDSRKTITTRTAPWERGAVIPP